ncbi:MAG: hypothetical protein MHMPM18_003275 [Marteilia pararefringens]
MNLSFTRLGKLAEINLGDWENRLLKMKDLRLDNAKLKTVPMRLFELMPNLETLDLSSNNLTSIPVGLANSCRVLRILNVRCNSIKTIKSSTLRKLANSVLQFNISHNHLHTIDLSSLRLFKSTVNLSANALATLQTTENRERSIKSKSQTSFIANLDLSCNRICHLGGELLDLLGPSLVSLNLSFNQIEEIEPSSQHSVCRLLKSLDMSNNGLRQLDCLSVSYCKQLPILLASA